MLFNSLDFGIFLPIVFFLYWFVFNRNIKQQNLFIVCASYVFYGWWDWKFLFLIFLSTTVDYIIGLQLEKEQLASKRKILIITSLLVNLGLLAYFKYFNFFIDNFKSAFTFFGADLHLDSLNIILPVGISFYTFQTLSYSIDVYKRKILPTNDFISFAAFVSFFPQLVAGPIERASHLLPQFQNKRTFNYGNAVAGLRQALWGLFKKIVIADNCAVYVNHIFNHSSELSGSTLFLGGIFFAFQIYGDFSGYSDIAIGTAKLFDFKLMQNFAFPYFSRDIAEFWRRWHISLSTWFRDYLYIPLGGSRGGNLMKIRNTFIIFIVSGFWHGANWTFIIWGALNAIYFLPLLLTKAHRSHMKIVADNSFFPSVLDFLKIGFTFFFTVIAWIFFRAENANHAFNILKKIFSSSFFELPYYEGLGFSKYLFILIVLFLLVEWLGRKGEYTLQFFRKFTPTFRWILYSTIIFLIAMFMHTEESDFIYFQF